MCTCRIQCVVLEHVLDIRICEVLEYVLHIRIRTRF